MGNPEIYHCYISLACSDWFSVTMRNSMIFKIDIIYYGFPQISWILICETFGKMFFHIIPRSIKEQSNFFCIFFES
jgi:hypothetical protein